jgi:hypothetical protein
MGRAAMIIENTLDYCFRRIVMRRMILDIFSTILRFDAGRVLPARFSWSIFREKLLRVTRHRLP